MGYFALFTGGLVMTLNIVFDNLALSDGPELADSLPMLAEFGHPPADHWPGLEADDE